MKEIEGEKDVEVLVDSFYSKVFADNEIGMLFEKIKGKNWDKHRATMIKFWMNVLFYTGNYYGNPLYVHTKLNQESPLNRNHFNQWLKLFYKTVDENFKGEIAELAKQRAISIATVMQIKIFQEAK